MVEPGVGQQLCTADGSGTSSGLSAFTKPPLAKREDVRGITLSGVCCPSAPVRMGTAEMLASTSILSGTRVEGKIPRGCRACALSADSCNDS